MTRPAVNSIGQLIGLALELGGARNGGLSSKEQTWVARAEQVDSQTVRIFRESLERGEDPLGEAYLQLHTPARRRLMGATYTPENLVEPMARWVAAQAPARVVEPGAGSGRFIAAVGRLLPRARLIAVERDPVAAVILRAHLAASQLAERCEIHLEDYLGTRIEPIKGRTAYLGNPPYVRHHDIGERQKKWLARVGTRLGVNVSKLSGLHVHFLFATACLASPQDIGCFVTSAEWLDVNYGRALRWLFTERLGLNNLQMLSPLTRPFADAETTATIACFEIGSRPTEVRVNQVEQLSEGIDFNRGTPVATKVLQASERWSSLLRQRQPRPAGFVELGEICRVHRGQVTGNNRVWVAQPAQVDLPGALLFPTVTKARELFAAEFAITDPAGLRVVIDIPNDLDSLSSEDRAKVELFLSRARALCADQGYIARHRRAWWSVGLYPPAPILATYMARRPPTFVRNLGQFRHLNIAHGLYPKVPLSARALDELTRYLRSSVSCSDGRTYAGGLTKFEPKEMERLLVPEPA